MNKEAEKTRLARLGAEAQVKDLNIALELIYAVFPDMRPGAATSPAKASGGKKPGRRQQTNRAWSAAARKAVSERMKKYWAARRAKGASK